MTNIHFQTDRQGLTVLPDSIDEATGERIAGTSQVVDTRVANWEGQSDETYEQVEQSIYEQEEAIAEDPDHPDSELDAVVLADVSDEIHQSTVTPDETVASAVISADMSDSPADVTVQFLAHQVYSGNISAEEAFNEALNSGVNHAALVASFQKLKGLTQ